jgi:hypothetical protein
LRSTDPDAAAPTPGMLARMRAYHALLQHPLAAGKCVVQMDTDMLVLKGYAPVFAQWRREGITSAHGPFSVGLTWKTTSTARISAKYQPINSGVFLFQPHGPWRGEVLRFLADVFEYAYLGHGWTADQILLRDVCDMQHVRLPSSHRASLNLAISPAALAARNLRYDAV